MIAWLLLKLTGDRSLKALLRLRAENKELERENQNLRRKVKEHEETLRAIVRAARGKIDIW